jgi:hypothetical protein
MKKAIVFLCAVALVFGVVGFASATPLTFNSVDGWWYGVQAEGKITLDGLDTFSYCVERQQHISIGGSYDAIIREIGSSNYLQEAKLVATFAPSLHGAYEGEAGTFTKMQTGAALQLAIWSSLGLGVSDITNTEIWGLANYMKDHVNTGISGISWADLGDNQDLLVAKHTPAPATMLLFGSGLIGLAVLGRKRFR